MKHIAPYLRDKQKQKQNKTWTLDKLGSGARLVSQLLLMPMDCDFGLLHSRAMIFQGKRICPGGFIEVKGDRKGEGRQKRNSGGDVGWLEHIAPST